MAGSSSIGVVEKVEGSGARLGVIRNRYSRREWTLVGIKVILLVLLLSSVLCTATQIWVSVQDSSDGMSFVADVMMLLSASSTLIYIILHNIFAMKQMIWRHQGGNLVGDKRTSYVAVRFAASLCVLWLLTGGWNMIIVARRPVCLPEGDKAGDWQGGKTCRAERVGISFSMVALVASCALFAALCTVSRPFEAHFLSCKPGSKANATPDASRRTSPSRSTSVASERRYRVRPSFSTHRSITSMDMGPPAPMPTSTIIPPAPIRSLGLQVLNSTARPPQRISSVDLHPPLFNPSLSRSTPHLPLPSRLPTVYLPPAQYAPSAWRAVHPSPLVSSTLASRNGSFVGMQGSQYRARYSRSSISLTRPHRLSGVMLTGSASASTSERSESASPDKGSRRGEDIEGIIAWRRDENGGLWGLEGRKFHARRVSAPERKVEGMWKAGRSDVDGSQTRGSEDDGSDKSASRIELRMGSESEEGSDQHVRVRKVRSDEQVRPPVPAKAASRTATTRKLHSEDAGKKSERVVGAVLERERRLTFDEVKNKPLPRIAPL